jgi:hypothetical protein
MMHGTMNVKIVHLVSYFLSYIIYFVTSSFWCMSNFAPSNIRISEYSFIALCCSQHQCKMACHCATFHGTTKWHARTTATFHFSLHFHCTFNTHMIYTSNSLQFDSLFHTPPSNILKVEHVNVSSGYPDEGHVIDGLLSKPEGLTCNKISHVTHITNSERLNFACYFCKFLLKF